MPTLTFSLADLQQLVGKNLTVEDVESWSSCAKGDFEGYDKQSDEVKIDFGDTNLPYLWSVEGFARLLRGLMGKQKGIPPLKVQPSGQKIQVDASVNAVRPYIAAFIAKGRRMDDYLLKQIIQLQEKLCETYGRKRRKIAICIYSHKKITFPISYKAVDPESVSFVPLEFSEAMPLSKTLKEPPKGKQYAALLKDAKKCPLLLDDKGEVLSFPPIINSSTTGKVEENETDLFFEATGDDMDALLLATNIFAYAFSDRGFQIQSVEIQYPSKKMVTPHLFKEMVKLKKEAVKDLLGLEIPEKELKQLLEKMGYQYTPSGIIIPPYRKDILHPNDVIEDIGIAYGYDKIGESPLRDYTVGEKKPIVHFIDSLREAMVGLGFNEVLSAILSSKQTLYEKAGISDFGTVEIKSPLSETYSAVRSWILPILLECLSKNKHVEYPQKIFEQGEVVVRNGDQLVQYERMAVAITHEKADFTEIRQVLDYLLTLLQVECTLEETEHSSFLPGRVTRVSVEGKKIAFMGEIAPAVLSNFGIEMPVAALEMNLTELFEILNKKKK